MSLSLLPRLLFYDLNTDVFLSLNGNNIPNHTYVVISDIGSSDGSALLCHTNRPPQVGQSISGGNWFAPNGTRINEDDVKGFTRDRGSKVVRLKGTTTGPPPEGMYWCSIQDTAGTPQTIYVGLYNSGQGMYIMQFQ